MKKLILLATVLMMANGASAYAQGEHSASKHRRLMNSHAFIDQAAAFIMTSVKTARSLGIPEANWVFLHGCADGHDHWYVSERIDFHSSPAIRRGIRLALDMAGRRLDAGCLRRRGR